MRKLIVEENQFSYVGIFSKPALSLWADGARIFDGLLTAFAPYGVNLSDINISVINQSPAGQIITADLDPLGKYGFRFDQVEWSADDLTEDEISEFPQVLQRGEDWLRSVVPDLSIKSHALVYLSHSRLSEGNSKEYLSSFSERDVPGIGINLGSGIFYHWEISNSGWIVHLAIDHSRTVTDGLFVQIGIEINNDRINFKDVTTKGRTLLEYALAKIGLEYEREE